MRLLFLLFLLSISNILLAQQANLKGQVTDANTKEKLEFATISIKSETDPSKIQGAKSKDGGLFSIEKIPFGTYTITISSIGYESKIIKNYKINQEIINLNTVALNSNSKQLKDVTIVGEKASMEIGIDKKTFNVDKNITSAGGTAADILRNVPSVNVDLDGNLSVRGKENVTLLVDGKPSAMFGNDAATALATIPASSIESVEVITNPSSKYEAQGMGGIVNIILKKDRKPGYNGMITLGAGAPFRLNGGLNLNANINKLNIFMNANARTSRTWEKTTNNRDNYDNDLTYYSTIRNDRRPLSGFMNLGAEYSFNKNNKLTLSQSIFSAAMKGDSKTNIINGENYVNQLSRQYRTNLYTGNPLNGTTNLQFKHTFKDPKEDINFDISFSKSRYIRTSEFNTSLYDSNDVFINSFNQKNPIRGGNWNGTFVVDYTKPIGKKARIDIGERSYFIQFKSENQPTIQYLNQSEAPEAILKNHFVFNQQVHGVYANYANQFNKTGIQLGLRGEYFAYQGTVYQYNASANDSYFNLFPTLFVSQKLTKSQDLNFNYSRRVNRPNFYQLIPFIDVNNPQDTSMGNPNLRPEFINATELTYSNQYGKGNTFMGSVYYQYTENLIQRYRRFNANGTTFSQNRNLATGQTYGLELTNKMNILSWWDATMNINVFRNKINGANVDASLTRTGYGGFGKLTSNMKFTKDFSGQLTGNYFATTVIAQGEVKPYGNIDIALKKSFMKNFITLTVSGNDILNTIQTNTVYNLFPYYNQSVLRKNQTRSVGINLQIRIASKSQRNSTEMPKKPQTKKDKEKEAKSRDENLKKEDGGGDDNGGNREKDK
jgi:outer membrane receptor protein involved in Fe transport